MWDKERVFKTGLDFQVYWRLIKCKITNEMKSHYWILGQKSMESWKEQLPSSVVGRRQIEVGWRVPEVSRSRGHNTENPFQMLYYSMDGRREMRGVEDSWNQCKET